VYAKVLVAPLLLSHQSMCHREGPHSAMDTLVADANGFHAEVHRERMESLCQDFGEGQGDAETTENKCRRGCHVGELPVDYLTMRTGCLAFRVAKGLCLAFRTCRIWSRWSLPWS